MSAMFSENLRKRVGCPFKAFRDINAYGLKEINYDKQYTHDKRKAEDDLDEEEHCQKIRKVDDELKEKEFMKQNKDEPQNEPKDESNYSDRLRDLIDSLKEMPETPVKGENEKMEPDAIY
jgi:hypothetical protein